MFVVFLSLFQTVNVESGIPCAAISKRLTPVRMWCEHPWASVHFHVGFQNCSSNNFLVSMEGVKKILPSSVDCGRAVTSDFSKHTSIHSDLWHDSANNPLSLCAVQQPFGNMWEKRNRTGIIPLKQKTMCCSDSCCLSSNSRFSITQQFNLNLLVKDGSIWKRIMHHGHYSQAYGMHLQKDPDPKTVAMIHNCVIPPSTLPVHVTFFTLS